MIPSAGNIISSDTALLSSTTTLTTIEYVSESKIRYTKLRDWMNVFTLLYEKTLKQTIVDKNIDDKEAHELIKIYTQQLDQRKEKLKYCKFRGEQVFGDIPGKESISPEQITNFNNFLAKVT